MHQPKLPFVQVCDERGMSALLSTDKILNLEEIKAYLKVVSSFLRAKELAGIEKLLEEKDRESQENLDRPLGRMQVWLWCLSRETLSNAALRWLPRAVITCKRMTAGIGQKLLEQTKDPGEPRRAPGWPADACNTCSAEMPWGLSASCRGPGRHVAIIYHALTARGKCWHSEVYAATKGAEAQAQGQAAGREQPPEAHD